MGINYSRTCNNCRCQGNKKQKCCELLENAEKRPIVYKSKTEHAHVTMQLPDTEEIEYVLCAVAEEPITNKKDSDGHMFNGHDEYSVDYKHLYGDVIACEEEELEEYELIENDVVKEYLNKEVKKKKKQTIKKRTRKQ